MFTRAELSLTQRLADFDTTTTMATVHPSRMGLIPQEMRGSQQDRTRARSPSPRRPRGSPSPRRSPSRERERGRDERQSRRDRDASNDRAATRTGPMRLAEPVRNTRIISALRRLPGERRRRLGGSRRICILPDERTRAMELCRTLEGVRTPGLWRGEQLRWG